MRIYSVTPESVSEDATVQDGFRVRLDVMARRSERAGWSGMLVPHNLHEVDPWVVTGYLGSVTTTIVPLLALQPACTPPHAAAACASAYAMLYDRPVYFNLVAGARDDEMRKIGDSLSHDERYERLREYAGVLRGLLGGEAVTADGSYYRYRKFRLEPRPKVLEQCKIFIAGSSPASLSVATELADVVVTHPVPFADWREQFLRPLRASDYGGELGIRIGIISRPSGEEAWRIANERFPESWIGEQETVLKTQSPNVWSRELARRAVAEAEDAARPGSADCYWLGAFHRGHANTPFLVGTYEEVAQRLAEYTRSGVGHVLLSGSFAEEEDFGHISEAVRLAVSA
jgi:alkanesulfonate monooxygenase